MIKAIIGLDHNPGQSANCEVSGAHGAPYGR